ncbi:putative ATP/GTP phosphatase [Pillotina sp. SPG140]|jgi:AAA15 family ATPase/GTPase
MKYSSIQIANFRSIAGLQLENFKQINLITGRNNCGKTTVLEALFQISGMSNPQLPVTINNFRDLALTSDDNFNFIFHNLDFNQEPHICAMLDNSNRDLIIKPKYADLYNEKIVNTGKVNLITENKIMANVDGPPIVTGLLLEFNNGEVDKKFTSEISLSDGRVTISNRYKERLSCAFHSPQLAMTMLPQRIEKLLVNKQMGGVIEALKEIDASITDIRMGANGMMYIDTGLDKLFPVHIMGDGIRRILSILAAVSDMQGGVLLIDEIENGLHYSTLKTLWKALLKAVEVYHVQLFATTHSNECIGALASLYDNAPQKSDSIRLYRIERNEGAHRAFEYPSGMIAAGIDSNIEMR